MNNIKIENKISIPGLQAFQILVNILGYCTFKKHFTFSIFYSADSYFRKYHQFSSKHVFLLSFLKLLHLYFYANSSNSAIVSCCYIVDMLKCRIGKAEHLSSNKNGKCLAGNLLRNVYNFHCNFLFAMISYRQKRKLFPVPNPRFAQSRFSLCFTFFRVFRFGAIQLTVAQLFSCYGDYSNRNNIIEET